MTIELTKRTKRIYADIRYNLDKLRKSKKLHSIAMEFAKIEMQKEKLAKKIARRERNKIYGSNPCNQ